MEMNWLLGEGAYEPSLLARHNALYRLNTFEHQRL